MSAYHCFIEAKLAVAGTFNRDDLMSAFDVAAPTATRQIASYRREHAGALFFNTSRHAYEKGDAFSTPNLSQRKVTPEEFLRAVEIVYGTQGKEL